MRRLAPDAEIRNTPDEKHINPSRISRGRCCRSPLLFSLRLQLTLEASISVMTIPSTCPMLPMSGVDCMARTRPSNRTSRDGVLRKISFLVVSSTICRRPVRL